MNFSGRSYKQRLFNHENHEKTQKTIENTLDFQWLSK